METFIQALGLVLWAIIVIGYVRDTHEPGARYAYGTGGCFVGLGIIVAAIMVIAAVVGGLAIIF